MMLRPRPFLPWSVALRAGVVLALVFSAASAARASLCDPTATQTPYPSPTPYPTATPVSTPGFTGAKNSPRVKNYEVGAQADIKDSILRRREFTAPQLTAMDLNTDGAVDVADYNLAWLRANPKNLSDFWRASQTAVEGDGFVFIPLQFAFPFTGTLGYSVSGSAIPGVDYVALPGVQQVNGLDNTGIQIQLLDDANSEDVETIVITLLSGNGYTAGLVDTFTLTVSDNDVIFLATADSGLAKSDVKIQFTQYGGVLSGALVGAAGGLIAPGTWPLNMGIDPSGTLSANTGFIPIDALASPFEGVAYQRIFGFTIKGFDPLNQVGLTKGVYTDSLSPVANSGVYAFTRGGALTMIRVTGFTNPPEPVLEPAP